MDTTTSNINSDISEVKIARIRRKLFKEVEWIKNQNVNECVIKCLPRALRYFATKSPRRDYHSLNDLILRYMGTILDVEKRCITEHLKEMFDNILPELTEWCGIIAINAVNAPFLLQFFSIWSEIVSGMDKSIQRLTALNKISALINICETIFKTGHFHTQLNGLELLLRYIEACEREEKEEILKDIIPSEEFRKIRDLLCNIDISNFEFDARDFLNEFNMIISEEEPVYSIAVEKGYIGEKPIIKPMHEAKECVLWVDFNSATESISFYCHSTTFFPNTEKWTNIEVKFPTKINIDRRKCEFHVFANRDDIEVYPLPTRQIFLQPKIIFKFTYIENDLSSLQKVISCYSFKKKTNNISVYVECDNFYTGFKTFNTKVNRETGSLAPKLPLPKIETNVRKPLQDLTCENFPQNGPEKQFFENITTRINKNQKDVLAFKSDISSVQNTSTGNKILSTEEIVSTSGTSKLNMRRTTTTTTTDKTNENSNADLNESNNVTKDSKLHAETYKKDKIMKGKAKVSAHKKNDEMNNRKLSKEITNDASANQKVKKHGKSNIETVHDNAIKFGQDEMKTVKNENREITNVASCTQKIYANISGKSHTETIVRDNQKAINAKRNQTTTTKNSGKAEIETLVSDNCTQKVNTEKSGKTEIETVRHHEILNDTNLKNELHISKPQNTISELNPPPEIIPQNKSSNYIQKENQDHSVPETNAEKSFDTDIENPRQSPKSASKRKLYTPIAEVHIGSQLSKDSQLQRRKYLQERRKTENRNSLKLINLVKPLEFSEKNDEVKDHENSNVINASIAGNEQQNQEAVEEYVNNKGYVGIKSSLKCPGVADKFSPQQQEAIENNLKTLNSIFVNSAKKFFKSESTLHIEQLDVYNVRNAEDDPAPAKKGRKRKVKEKITPPIKMNVVPKYIGTNTKVSHSYRRSKGSNLGNMKKVLTTKEDNTDFDKLKHGDNSNTTAKEKSEPVGVLEKRQSASLKKNINYEKSEGSMIKVDTMNTTGSAKITAETPQKTLSSKSSNNTQEGNITQVQQISNQILNPLSNQAVHGENSNQSLNQNYNSEESVTQQFVRKEAMNNQFVKTITSSPEIERCNSAMANQSMAPNISFETKDSSVNRYEAKQKNNFEKQPLKRDSAQNDSHKTNSTNRVRLTEVKPGKYTSYDQNWDRNLEKSLDRSNYPNSRITTPLQEINATTNVESNWLIKKYLNSIPDQRRLDIEIIDYREEHSSNHFEDDYVDLDSYCSLESDDCICNEENNHLNDKRNVGNNAEQNSTEVINLELQLQTCQRKESLEKRKSPDPESKEIVPYKRVRTETTTDYNGAGIEGEILSNLRRKVHQLFASAVSNTNVNSDSEEIKGKLIEQLSTFMMCYERHNLQSVECWKQIQKLLTQIGKEKERFHLESFAAFNQFSTTQEALTQLKNISKTKYAEKLERFEKVRSSMKEAVAGIAKAEWEAYIDNLTSNIIKNIQRHMDFDLQL